MASWFYADSVAERSYYPQVGNRSDSPSFQRHYWRCIPLFYQSLRRYHPEVPALFFSNYQRLPCIDGVDLAEVLTQLQVEHCHLPFAHQPPPQFCRAWRNQFYLFSIVGWLAQHAPGLALVLDSDCLIRASLDPLFAAAQEKGYMSFLPLPQDDLPDDFPINDLSKTQLGELFSELWEKWPPGKPAPYCQGEFLLLSQQRSQQLSCEFEGVWAWALQRHSQGKSHFYEEAQTLSYLFCKLGMDDNPAASAYIRRMWTDANYARNIDLPLDRTIAIWHLPAEKKFGFRRLFRRWRLEPGLFQLSEAAFQRLLEVELNLSPRASSLVYRRLRFWGKHLLQRLGLRRAR